jgi:hypothetical protein
MDDGVTAHRVTDERDLLRADLVDHGDDIVTERREIPVVAAEPRLAVASQVDRGDVIPLGEDVDLMGPIGAVAGPSVHEDDGR